MHRGGVMARRAATGLALLACLMAAGCMSIESVNAKLAPVNRWYDEEYEASRFTQRYKFTETDAATVRAAALKLLPKIGLTASYDVDDIVASGNPISMFTAAECESWADIDRARTSELSSGMLKLSCNASNKNSLITATLSFKVLPRGTLMVLDYEVTNPIFAGYGVTGPRRPPPAAAKAGAAKIWSMLSDSLPRPIRNASKEDLT